MAYLVEADDISSGWIKLIKHLMSEGKYSAPRGFSTNESLNVCLHITKGLNNIIAVPKRDLNYRFMIAEWLWIMGELKEVEYLARFNSLMVNYSDDHVVLNGAYGPRLMPQMSYIVESLSKPDSRQAVATIWTPTPIPSKDIPCTISLQWFIREGSIHCTVNMRSSDVWKGIPYDYYNFSQITNYLASQLSVNVGSVTMNLGSSHLYDIDVRAAREVIRDREMAYVNSLHLPVGIKLPTTDEMKKLLMLERIPLLGPWAAYQSALIKDKAHALEVLRVLSSH